MEKLDVNFSPLTPEKSMTSFSHLRNLLSNLKSQKESKSQMCDLSLDMNGTKFNVHRIILAAHTNAYREKLLDVNNKEINVPLKVTKEDLERFSDFIDSLYAEQVSFKVHNPGHCARFISLFDDKLRENALFRYAKRMDLTPVQSLKILCCLHGKKYTHSPIQKIYDRVKMEVLSNFQNFYDIPKEQENLMTVPLDVFKFLVSHEGNGAHEYSIISLITSYIEENGIGPEEAQKLYSGIYKCDGEVRISPKLPPNVQEAARKTIAEKKAYRPGNRWFLMADFERSKMFYDIQMKEAVWSEKLDETVFKKLDTLLKDKNFLNLEIIDGQLGGLHKGQDNDSLPVFQKFENGKWVDCYKTQFHINDFIQSNFRVISVGGMDHNRGTQLIGSAVYGDGPWRMFKALDIKVQSHALIMVSGTVFRFGGFNPESGVLSTSFSIQLWPTASSWQTLAPMPEGCVSASSVHFDGKIYLFGGKTSLSSGIVIENNMIYDIAANSWEIIPKCGTNFWVFKSFEISGLIYLVGKEHSTQPDAQPQPNRLNRNGAHPMREGEEVDDEYLTESEQSIDADHNEPMEVDETPIDLKVYTFDPKTKEYSVHGDIKSSHEIDYKYAIKFSQYDLDNIN